MITQVPILVSNAAALVDLGFTRVEVWHSGNQGTSFQEITASVAGRALLVSKPAMNTFTMGGRLLKFRLNGADEVSVSFQSLLTNWTPQQVADQINLVVSGLASVQSSAKTITLSGSTGRVSSIEITYNDASDLGWVSGQVVRGTDARIVLDDATLSYLYTDLGGDPTDLYKWRFSANGVNPISAFSAVIPGNIPPPTDNVAYATALFLDLSGVPIQRTVIFVSDGTPQSIDEGLDVGVQPYTVGNETPLVVRSDANGFLQVPLVVGTKLRAAIEGTAFVREFVVPGPPGEVFDLLTVLATAPDPFTVQTTPPFLTRRSI